MFKSIWQGLHRRRTLYQVDDFNHCAFEFPHSPDLGLPTGPNLNKCLKKLKIYCVRWGKVVYCVARVHHCGAKVQPGDKTDVSVEMVQGIFTGTTTHFLDPKKRLTIPSEWRDQVGVTNNLYVLPDLVGRRFLNVFTAREMVKRLQSIRNLPVADEKGRQFARLLGSQSQLVPWDSAGRIRINDALLEEAKLSDKIVLVGVFDHFELWNPDLWKESESKKVEDLREAAQYVGF